MYSDVDLGYLWISRQELFSLFMVRLDVCDLGAFVFWLLYVCLFGASQNSSAYERR